MGKDARCCLILDDMCHPGRYKRDGLDEKAAVVGAEARQRECGNRAIPSAARLDVGETFSKQLQRIIERYGHRGWGQREPGFIGLTEEN